MITIKFSKVACQGNEKYNFSIYNNYCLRVKKGTNITSLIRGLCNILSITINIRKGLFYNYIEIHNCNNRSAKKYIFNFVRLLHYSSRRDIKRFARNFDYITFMSLRRVEHKLNTVLKVKIDTNEVFYGKRDIQYYIYKHLKRNVCSLSFFGLREIAFKEYIENHYLTTQHTKQEEE